MSNGRSATIRRYTKLILLILGLGLVGWALSGEVAPSLDITAGFGILQMTQLLVGITALTITGYIHVNELRPEDAPKSLQADIGGRLVATGLVFSWVAGFSDLLQIGTHSGPEFERPFVGPWQLSGIVLSILVIAVGLLLMHTSRGRRQRSSLDFITQEESVADPHPSTPETTVSAEQTPEA